VVEIVAHETSCKGFHQSCRIHVLYVPVLGSGSFQMNEAGSVTDGSVPGWPWQAPAGPGLESLTTAILKSANKIGIWGFVFSMCQMLGCQIRSLDSTYSRIGGIFANN
jgi:hypothetical protein